MNPTIDQQHLQQLRGNRLLRWSGLTAAVALLTGVGLLGDTPDTRDSSNAIAAYFVEHRASVLAGAVLIAVSVCAWLTFGSALQERLSRGGAPVHGRVVGHATTVIATLLVTLMATVYTVLSYVVGQEAPESAKGLFEISLVATPLIAGPLALFYAATAWAIVRGAGARWFGWLTACLTIVPLIGLVSFARRGYFSPDVQQQVVFETLIAWLVTASIVLGRARSTTPETATMGDPGSRGGL